MNKMISNQSILSCHPDPKTYFPNFNDTCSDIDSDDIRIQEPQNLIYSKNRYSELNSPHCIYIPK